MKKPVIERIGDWFHAHIKIPRGVIIAICIFPAVLTALFYILRPVRSAMNRISANIARPVRGFFGMLSSIYPVALMEVLCTIAVILLIYYIIKAIADSSRKRKKWSLLGRRFLGLLVVACYFYASFCWLWSSGYYTDGFAQQNGYLQPLVQTEDLAAVTRYFAQQANELSVQVPRDSDGSFVFARSEMFEQSKDIYRAVSGQFPSLAGTIYEPKPMYMYSWLMTITKYTGMYFALTGEAMINIQQPAAYMPSTIAHELAHQLGVFAEDEANFVGILACVTSDVPIYKYSGYLSGLGYLLSALAGADSDEFLRISSGLADEVKHDRSQNALFWANAADSNLGIDFLDNFISTMKRASNNVVDAVYDNYLKSQEQELGLATYGKCTDLLVEHFAPIAGGT